MYNLENLSDYEKTIIAVYIGENMLHLLPKSEGYFYCKEKLSLCWKWIERCEINLDDYANCLDNPSEKDLVYYTSNEKDKDIQEVYGMILQSVSYTAMQAITENGLGLPEYLDDIDDEYLYSIIDLAIKRCKNMEKKINLVIQYCSLKVLNEPNIAIKMNEIMSI